VESQTDNVAEASREQESCCGYDPTADMPLASRALRVKLLTLSCKPASSMRAASS